MKIFIRIFHFTFFISILAIKLSFAQKQIITKEAVDNWKELVALPEISHSGNYIGYTINNGMRDNASVIIQNINNGKKTSYDSVNNFTFAKFSENCVIDDPKRSQVIIFDPIHNADNILHSVKKHQVVTSINNDFLIYTEGIANKLNILNLMTNKKISVDSVVKYKTSTNSLFIIVQIRTKLSSKVKKINISNGEAEDIYEAKSIEDYIVSANGENIALLVKEGDKKNIYYYCPEKSNAAVRVDISNLQLEKNSILENLTRIGNDGQTLVATFSKKISHVPLTSNVNIYKTSDEELNIMESSIQSSKNYSVIINLASQAIEYSEKDGENISFLTNDQDDYILINYAKGDIRDYSWDPNVVNQSFLLHIRSGKREPFNITRFLGITLDAKIAIGQRYPSQNIIVHNLGSSVEYNLADYLICRKPNSQNIEVQELSRNFQLAGWLANSNKIFIYDQYDIWLVDLNAPTENKCITNFVGEKSKIIFRLAEISKSKLIYQSDSYILSAFKTQTKENGFYNLTVTKESSILTKLTMGNYFYYSQNIGLPGMPPFRNIKKNNWIVRRQSATAPPNYYLTKNFKDYKKITDLQPHANYNWYTTSLINFKSLSGDSLQAVLYKPENYDSTKKYPLVIHYYEQLSNFLNIYRTPKLSPDNINIPWLLSRGYMVCTPDIVYTQGNPGVSAYNSIISISTELKKLPFIDSTKMAIMGHSFGGYETNYIVTHTNQFAAAISAAGISDLLSYYLTSKTNNDLLISFVENGQIRMGKSYWDSKYEYLQNSPIQNADKITSPLLLMHNKLDVAVPYSQAVEFFLALKRLRKKAWLIEYPNENHSVETVRNQIDYTQKIDEFLDYYLKGAVKPNWM